MLYRKILLGFGSASMIIGGAITGYADGSEGDLDQTQASADASDASSIYYAQNNVDNSAENLGYVVNRLPVPSLKQLPKQNLAKTVMPAKTYIYTIAPGDTVYSLARRNCVSIQDIKIANGINSKFEIRAGDKIILPTDRC